MKHVLLCVLFALCGLGLPRVWAACVLKTPAEQQFAANLRDSIQQQTSRLLEQAGMMQDVEIP